MTNAAAIPHTADMVGLSTMLFKEGSPEVGL